MTFAIATNEAPQQILPKSGMVDAGMNVRFTDWTRADRTKRQIIEAIEAHECPDMLAEYMDAEELLIDAIHLFDDSMAAEIQEAAADHTSILRNVRFDESGSAPAIPAIAQSPQSKEIKMFATNQTEGSRGPWMTWTSNGSAEKGFPPRSWVMRGKDANDTKFESVIPGFANPCVFDLESLKLGWEKDGAAGQAPDRRYSSHYSVPMARPDESKKINGAFAWSNCLQVRVAISQTEAVTWEQGSFGAYQAFNNLAKLIEAEWPQHSQNGALLPVVQQTSVEARKLTSGNTNIPVLSIVKWVPRPDCLKDDAPTIATGAAAQPAAQTPPPPQPDNSAVSAAGGF